MLQKGHGFVLWGHSVAEAYMLAFLVIRACEVQIASGAGNIKPYVPPQPVLDITVQQAKIITLGEAPFNQVTWQTLLRKLDRDVPILQDLMVDRHACAPRPHERRARRSISPHEFLASY